MRVRAYDFIGNKGTGINCVGGGEARGQAVERGMGVKNDAFQGKQVHYYHCPSSQPFPPCECMGVRGKHAKIVSKTYDAKGYDPPRASKVLTRDGGHAKL